MVRSSQSRADACAGVVLRWESMRHTLIRLLLVTIVVCGVADQARAQAASVASQAMPDLAPLYKLVPIDSAATHPSSVLRGIYAFFASDTARAFLRRVGLSVGDDGLVYIGQTKDSFRQRLARHFTGTSETSTLRRSLKSILSHAGLKAERADVSRFMRSHLKVALLAIDDAAVIDTVEARLIRAKSPPLNTAGISNANTRKLKQLRKVLGTASTRTTFSTLAKGTGIVALVELPVTAVVEYLHVRNGRKTPEEAVLDGAGTVGVTAFAGAVMAGAFSAAAATAGITVSAPVVVPLAVVFGGGYVLVSGERIWDALGEGTRTAVEARFAAVATAVPWGSSEAAADQ